MGFSPFIILSLIYVVIAIRVVRQLIANWRETWDLRFTSADRSLVDQSAFFVLVPVSVALHELGHAIAIWSFGGRVIDFGFYGFAGYVSYREPFTDVQRILVAFAGPFVNFVLAAGALALVFLRKPPMRAAYNELMIQFAILSAGNAFIVYPLLDVLGGLHGDWQQMYFGGAPVLSGIIFVWHAAIIGFGYWFLRDLGVKARVAPLVGAPRGYERAPLGGIRPASSGSQDAADSPKVATLREAGSRVSGGWRHPVKGAIQPRGDGTALILTWQSMRLDRAVMAHAKPDGSIDLLGAAGANLDSTPLGASPRTSGTGNTDPIRRHLERLPPTPDIDALTLALRLAMETVEEW